MNVISESAAEYGIWFNISGLILCAIIVILFNMQRQIPNRQSLYFAMLIYEVTALNIVSFCHRLYVGDEHIRSIIPGIVDYIIVYLDKILIFLVPFLVFLYSLSVFNIKLNRKQVLFICIIPELTVLFVILSGIFTPYFFELDPVYHEITYHYPQGPVIYIGIFIDVFLGIYYGIKYRKALPIDKYACFWAYVALTLAGIPIRIITRSAAIFEFFMVLSLLLCLFTLQSPSESVDMESGLLNYNALRLMCTSELQQKNAFMLVGITIPDMSYLESTMTSEDSRRIVKVVSEYMKCLDSEAEIFRTTITDFILLIREIPDDYDEFKSRVEKLVKRFDEPWKIRDENYILPAASCIVKCPDDGKSTEDIIEIFELARRENRDKQIVDVRDLNIMQNAFDKKVDEIVKKAVDNNMLEVFYQPIYNPVTGVYDSAEALLRLKSNEFGYISPNVFIPIAEHNGAIVQMDYFVLEQVCRMLRNTNVPGLGIKYIELNLSVVDCIQSNLVEKIQNMLNKFKIPYDRINFEITETAAEELTEVVYKNVNELHNTGFTFSLDDFGTGYSNLNRLTRIPYKLIKIDKTIIQSALNSETMYRVLKGMIGVGKFLNADVVAEGVESGEQAREAIRLGCGHLQGYFYARPMPLEDFVHFLEDNN